MSDDTHHGAGSPPMGAGKVTHRTPPPGNLVTLCCGKAPRELPRWDLLSNDADMVNCHGHGHTPDCALDEDHRGRCRPAEDVYEGHVPKGFTMDDVENRDDEEVKLPRTLPVKWGDSAQYHQERRFTLDSTPGTDDGKQGVVPTVRLLSMTSDPLGVIAAMAAMYEGRVVRHLEDLSAQDREQAWDNVLKTHLNTPLEAVQLHFLLEGVDRAFTHQLVRQRVGAAYAQESLRFAVVDDLASATTLPPSLQGTLPDQEYEGDPAVTRNWSQEQWWRVDWDRAIAAIDMAYRRLVDSGMPAEEARGLLPQATATRVHYVTNLRALSDHAGNRLCTQAQFVWRQVFAKIIEAIRNYDPLKAVGWLPGFAETIPGIAQARDAQRWQYEAVADSALFRPICYKLGRCPFKADFDRACSIRDRVEVRSKHGSIDSKEWHKPFMYDNPKYNPSKGVQGQSPYITSEGIDPAEWLANPAAARS